MTVGKMMTGYDCTDILNPRLATSPVFSSGDYRAVPEKYRVLIPEYVRDYVALNQF